MNFGTTSPGPRLRGPGERRLRITLKVVGISFIAGVYPLAAGALAWAGISLSPAVGAVLMSASTIVVAANAQLLRPVRLTPDR